MANGFVYQEKWWASHISPLYTERIHGGRFYALQPGSRFKVLRGENSPGPEWVPFRVVHGEECRVEVEDIDLGPFTPSKWLVRVYPPEASRQGLLYYTSTSREAILWPNEIRLGDIILPGPDVILPYREIGRILGLKAGIPEQLVRYFPLFW